MLLGLLAGRVLTEARFQWKQRFVWLAGAGVACMVIAYGIHAAGICPIVKRIWTPSWVLWSGGICFLLLGVLGVICDHVGLVGWGFPFMVIGANSIVAYVMSWTLEGPTIAALKRHFSWLWDSIASGIASLVRVEEAGRGNIAALIYGALTLLVFWLVLYWLYRRRIFVKI
jgi:heparan-alpha-glucosaminide N-acetyltransferase